MESLPETPINAFRAGDDCSLFLRRLIYKYRLSAGWGDLVVSLVVFNVKRWGDKCRCFNYCTVYVYPFCRHLQIFVLCVVVGIYCSVLIKQHNHTNSHSFFIDFTTWKGHHSWVMIVLSNARGGFPGFRSQWTWCGLLSKSLWVGCISSLKNHHASYPNQTIEEKKILGVPLFSGRWDITLISGALSEFKTNGNQPFLLGIWTLRKPCLTVCHVCHGHSIPVVYLKEGMGNFTLPKTSV